MCGQIAYDWKTMPRLRRFGGRNTRRGTEATTRPRRVISPASGRSRPATRRRVVVLPQPLGPRRVTTSPRRIRSDAPSTAGASPNALLTPSRARTVSALPGSVAPTAAPRLLHHRLGEVLRLHHFRQVLLGVDLVELGA